jgi:hypothetical protein
VVGAAVVAGHRPRRYPAGADGGSATGCPGGDCGEGPAPAGGSSITETRGPDIASDATSAIDDTGLEELAPIKALVEGTCPECGAEALRRYPVLAAEGWFEVVKCQRCLHSVSRERWHRLGFVHLPEDAL